jgi:RNA recognition motif-containing protein
LRNATNNEDFATTELFVRNINKDSTEESVLKLFRKQGGKIVKVDFLEGFGIASITYAHT